MKYQCPRCEVKFGTRQAAKAHVNNKKLCKCKNDVKPSEDTIIEIDEYEICEYCKKQLGDKYSLDRHYGVCKVLNRELPVQDKVKILEEEIRKLKEKDNTNITNNTTNNSIVNNTNNGIINNYNLMLNYKDDENSSHLDDDMLNVFSKLMVTRIPKMIECIHFDPTKPQNHNMYITNMRSEYAHAYNGKTWNQVNKKDFVNEIVDKYERMMNYWENDVRMQKIYRGIADNCESYDRKLQDKNAADKVIKDIELILYNNKAMVMGTRKHYETQALTNK